MGAPTKLVNLFAHAVSSSNGGTITVFTHGSSLKNPDGTLGYGGVLDRMSIYNADTITHTILVYRVPSSSSAADAFLVERVPLGTVSTYILEGPFYSTDTDTYQAKLLEAASSSTTLVNYQAWYHEMS
jgi:hypothetical protein